MHGGCHVHGAHAWWHEHCICGGGGAGVTDPVAGSTGDSPVFINDSTPGSLAVEKNVAWKQYDEDANFKFKVVLTTPGSKTVTGDWSYESKAKPAMYAFAVYSADDNSLNFYREEQANIPSAGSKYNGLTVTNVYTNIENQSGTYYNSAPWYSIRENVTNVTFYDTIKPKNCAGWFYGMSNLTSIDFEDSGGKLDASECMNMHSMFDSCYFLTSLILSSSFNTSNVTDMSCMFDGCYRLTSLTLSSSFNTSNVTDMRLMFNDCYSLTSLTLSDNFDTSNVTDMSCMFCYCVRLTSLTLPDSFDTGNVTDMYRMFEKCCSLTTLTLPASFDTSNVINMSKVFYLCSKLSLDCSSWDVSKVTNYYNFNESASGVTAPTWVS